MDRSRHENVEVIIFDGVGGILGNMKKIESVGWILVVQYMYLLVVGMMESNMPWCGTL
ncbi:hypothetical protein HanHA89_Chr15g0638831 [Helianthus annuus]|nr:hypothetical protein HanHA89_Chr15g0638831 [Helianthus annuus]